MTEDLLISTEGRIGRIRLNRPKALHALNTGMCQGVIDALENWRGDGAVEAVVIDHAEGRGFCAGGDIRMIAASGSGDGAEAREFFCAEYRMNHRLFTYVKPVVAVMDGITMGGGVGLSQPAKYRIATEHTKFAMPETGIGLFPDVGGGWYLSRLPGRVGMFLALTGARLDGAECLSLGLATHYLLSDQVAGVVAEIAADPQAIDRILAARWVEPPHPRILANRARIDRLFSGDSVEEILAALDADGGAWATTEAATLRTKSPQSLKVSHRIVVQGAHMHSFADEMTQEYAVATRIVQRPDFAEGVRALIIDKDNSPAWDPPALDGVTDHMIDRIFAPLPEDEAWTPA